MDPRQATIERRAHFTRGAQFYRQDDKLMFVFVIDATNTVGPRPAKDADRETHPDAWASFAKGEDVLHVSNQASNGYGAGDDATADGSKQRPFSSVEGAVNFGESRPKRAYHRRAKVGDA